MIKLLPASLMVVILAACGAAPSTSASAAPGTGMQGQVTIGPTCPVERITSPCPPRPLAARVTVRDGAGNQVAEFVSGADGHFKIAIRPGIYTLVGSRNGSAGLPRPIPATVVVTAGSYATVNVQYDSGIR